LNRAFIAVFGIAVFAAILFGSLAFETALAVKQPKVTICHVDPDGDGVGAETLEVNSHSLARHLAHGDGEGACLTCGNGLEEAGVGEECDDGNTAGGDGCSAICLFEICGNGIEDVGEECDDGNMVTEECAYDLTSCTVCASDCTEQAGATSFCGDSIIDGFNGENCDDGANNGMPGFCNATCDGQEPDLCGNGQIDGDEECDGTELGDAMCEFIPDGFNLEGNLQGNLQGNIKGSIHGAGDVFCVDCKLDFSLCNSNGFQ